MFNRSARIELNEDEETKHIDPYLCKGNPTECGIFKFFMNLVGGKDCLDH